MTAASVGGWGLVAGAALVGLALLIAALTLWADRAPRARGLTGSRWSSADRGLSEIGDRAGRVADGILARLKRGPALGDLLEKAGVDLRPGELIVVAACATLVAGLCGWRLGGPVLGLLAGAAAVAGTAVYLRVRHWRRRERFAAQLGDTLQMLGSALRAGYGVGKAVDIVAREAENPTAEEFQRCTGEVRLGRDFADALHALAARVDSLDFEWVVQGFEINQDVGGDLAELLDGIATTIRDRNRVRRQVSALSAEGRMSAAVLYILPFVMAGISAVVNPGYLGELTGTGGGHVLLGAAAVLMSVGGLWLRRIIKPQF